MQQVVSRDRWRKSNIRSRMTGTGTRVTEKSCKQSTQSECSTDPGEAQFLASAQAVVEAALWCHRIRGESEISDQTKSALVDAVFRDPSLTPHLFEPGALKFQWC